MVARLLRRDLHHFGNRMRRLERRNDPFELRAKLKGFERFCVGRRQISNAATFFQPRMFGAMPG